MKAHMLYVKLFSVTFLCCHFLPRSRTCSLWPYQSVMVKVVSLGTPMHLLHVHFSRPAARCRRRTVGLRRSRCHGFITLRLFFGFLSSHVLLVLLNLMLLLMLLGDNLHAVTSFYFLFHDRLQVLLLRLLTLE